MPEPQTPPPREPGPQPDPMLEPGRRSPGWVWLIALAVLVVVVGTLYGLNNQEPETAANQSAPPQTSGQSGAPSTAMPTGRTTGSAPPEQPADIKQNQAGSAPQGGQQQPQNSDQGNKPAAQGNQGGE
jgi:hypothetical protein